MNNLGNLHVIPALASADTTTTVTEAYTEVIDAGEATEIEFILVLGTIVGDTVVVKAYKDANTTGGGGTAIAFKYKKSAALGTDTSGAWTACASTGLTLTNTTDDNKVVRINIDPADCDNDYPYTYLGIDPGSSVTTFNHAAVAVVVPRYNQSAPSSLVD